MPIYEYLCKDCNTVFDALRGMSEADAAIECDRCGGTHTVRKISLFAAHSESRVVAGGNSGACSTCGGGACSSCSIH
jgi:putative FmdB family regulatory protein